MENFLRWSIIPSYKSTGYTPVKNYFRSWILAEVEQLFCWLNCESSISRNCWGLQHARTLRKNNQILHGDDQTMREENFCFYTVDLKCWRAICLSTFLFTVQFIQTINNRIRQIIRQRQPHLLNYIIITKPELQ